MASRKGRRLFLDQQNILVNDLDPESRYFGIDEFNPKFTGGKNVIVFNGSPLLKVGTPIQIEVLDVKNNPLYTEVAVSGGNIKYREGVAIAVTIHVQGDTPVGTGKVILVGTRAEDGQRVRWTRQISINSRLNNITKVRFYKAPELTLEPELSDVGNFATQSLSLVSGSVSSLAVSPKEFSNYVKFDKLREPTIYKLVDSSQSFLSKMTNEEIYLSNIIMSTGETLPETQSFVVSEVLNNSELLLKSPFVFPNSDSEKTVRGIQSADYSISYTPISKTDPAESSNQKTSIARVTLKNLRTFCGEVSRVKLFRKSYNQNSDDELISDTRIVSSEIFIDDATPNRELERIGFFLDQSVADNYWFGNGALSYETSSVDIIDGLKLTNLPTVVLDSDYYIAKDNTPTSSFVGDAEYIPPVEDEILSRGGSSWNTNFLTLFSGVEYDISATVYNDRIDASVSSNLEIYLTGSNLDYRTSRDFDGKKLIILNSEFPAGVNKTKYIVKSTFELNKDFRGTLCLKPSSDGFTISNISIKPKQAFSYNPDIFITKISFPIYTRNEKFLIRAELFDINNNSIPAKLETVKSFDTGGDSLFSASSLSKQVVSNGDPGKAFTVGQMAFDASINKPIWYTGVDWVDAQGSVIY